MVCGLPDVLLVLLLLLLSLLPLPLPVLRMPQAFMLGLLALARRLDLCGRDDLSTNDRCVLEYDTDAKTGKFAGRMILPLLMELEFVLNVSCIQSIVK